MIRWHDTNKPVEAEILLAADGSSAAKVDVVGRNKPVELKYFVDNTFAAIATMHPGAWSSEDE